MQGLERNATWDDQARLVNFPKTSSGITKEYETMNDTVAVKQADVVLIEYPLEMSTEFYDDDESLADLYYVSCLLGLLLGTFS